MCIVDPDCFKEEEDVIIHIGDKIVATASTCHIGYSTNKVLWGSLHANDGKTLVKIVEISYPNVKLP